MSQSRKHYSSELLEQYSSHADPGDIDRNRATILETLHEFDIDVQIKSVNVGPKVTRYTIEPDSMATAEKIRKLETNLALNLAATSIRIDIYDDECSNVAVDVPNVKPAVVGLSELLSSDEWTDSTANLKMGIGMNIDGKFEMRDLATLPNLLIAGQTFSGKSVFVNTVIVSLLYEHSPDELKLLLVDPKQVELAPYEDVPHLLRPVALAPDEWVSAIQELVAETDRRLDVLSQSGVRDIKSYNEKADSFLPYIVFIVDEFSDLMMTNGEQVEQWVSVIAEHSKQVGIHMIVATSRPGHDVYTSNILASFPARIGMVVAGPIDSQTILDTDGAEKLLGQGDMLYLDKVGERPIRLIAPYVSDDEVSRVVAALIDDSNSLKDF